MMSEVLSSAKALKGQSYVEPELPQFKCRSCNNCDGNRCSFFNRKVEPNFNKCFNHTFYNPEAIKFVPTSNFEELVREEEKQVA